MFIFKNIKRIIPILVVVLISMPIFRLGILAGESAAQETPRQSNNIFQLYYDDIYDGQKSIITLVIKKDDFSAISILLSIIDGDGYFINKKD